MSAEHENSGSFKHYLIRNCLGEGGFGQVYEAWDDKLGRKVALKRLKHAGQGQAGQDLIREARLAASLRHAAYVQIYSVEDDEDSQIIVMELIDGRTLKQVLEGGPLTAPAALDVVRQTAQAMAEAHLQGLVHGDLKASNIMLEHSGTVRILDFGLAARINADATASNIGSGPQGTIAYMAPELLSGARASAASDIYALGVVLYELLTGQRPFRDLNGLALAAAVVQSSSRSWEFPPQLDVALVRAIEHMTARVPQQRPPDMYAVADAMTEVLTGTGHPSLLPAREQVRVARHWRRAVLPALLAIAIGVAAVQLWPRFSTVTTVQNVTSQAVTPYSTSQEMTRGLAALRLYDRPGKLDEASRHFSRILQAEPAHAGAIAGMALMYTRRYQSENQDEVWLRKASAAAQQALKLDSHLALAHVADGVVLARAGKSGPGLVRLDHALRLDPGNVFALLGKVTALLTLRRYDDALAQAHNGLALHPTERSFADLAGRIHFEQGNYAAAEKSFRNSLRIEPDAVYAYANLNAALQRQGRADEAMQVLQRGLQVRPNAWLYGNLGTALFGQGDYPGAVAAFENAVSPTTGNPGDYLGWANLADALQWIPGREPEARRAYQRARQLLQPRLARAPEDATLASRMALYMARSSEAGSAGPLINRALAAAPDSLDVQFRAALVFELGGNRTRAIETLLKARTLGYPVSAIDAEPDLVALRRDARYRMP